MFAMALSAVKSKTTMALQIVSRINQLKKDRLNLPPLLFRPATPSSGWTSNVKRNSRKTRSRRKPVEVAKKGLSHQTILLTGWIRSETRESSPTRVRLCLLTRSHHCRLPKASMPTLQSFRSSRTLQRKQVWVYKGLLFFFHSLFRFSSFRIFSFLNVILQLKTFVCNCMFAYNNHNNKTEFRVAPRGDIPEFQFSKVHLNLCWFLQLWQLHVWQDSLHSNNFKVVFQSSNWKMGQWKTTTSGFKILTPFELLIIKLPINLPINHFACKNCCKNMGLFTYLSSLFKFPICKVVSLVTLKYAFFQCKVSITNVFTVVSLFTWPNFFALWQR